LNSNFKNSILILKIEHPNGLVESYSLNTSYLMFFF